LMSSVVRRYGVFSFSLGFLPFSSKIQKLYSLFHVRTRPENENKT
jgi:hypothetical protein